MAIRKKKEVAEKPVVTETKKEPGVFDYINSISYKKNLEYGKDYNAWLTNHYFSLFPDTVLYANEMNKNSFISPEMQYEFYLNGVRKANRYTKWIKKNVIEDIKTVIEYFNVSERKAKDLLEVLTENDLTEIREKIGNKGGIRT